MMTLLQKQTFLINTLHQYLATQETVAPPLPIQGPLFPDISPIAINSDGVTQLLATRDVHKATGPDHIPSRLLKEIFRNDH